MTPRDPLDELLDHWRAPTGPQPDLSTRIHREIAISAGSENNHWLRRLEAAFARPSFAITFVAACVLLGLFLAESRISRLHAAYGAQIARNYVQLIDPLLTTPPPAARATKGAP
jgi:hypothetical protein